MGLLYKAQFDACWCLLSTQAHLIEFQIFHISAVWWKVWVYAVWLEVWVYGCLAGSLGVRPLGVKFGCTVVWWEYLYVLSIMIWTTN